MVLLIRLSSVSRCELGHLVKSEVPELLQSLPLLGHADSEENTIVGLGVGSGAHIHGFLLLIYININYACLPVTEYAARNLGNRSGLKVPFTWQPPAESHYFGLLAINLLNYGACNRLLRLIFQFGNVGIGFPIAGKYFSMTARVLAGSKSPERQMAMLLGT